MNTGKILFVGCGHMGGALLEGWTKYGGLSKEDIIVAEPSDIIRKCLKKEGYKVFAGLEKLPRRTEIKAVVLAVRPDTFKEVLPLLAERLSPSALIISIAAGKKISFIESYLPNNPVIRIMPNMAVSQGLGISGLCASKKTKSEHKDYIFGLMSSCSRALWLEKEDDIHKIVALGGSSPAYIYSCALALQNAARDYGLPEDFVAEAAVNVFLGSAVLFARSEGSLSDAVAKIATKGGTTEAAVNAFNKGDALTKLFSKAMKACMARSKEMSK